MAEKKVPPARPGGGRDTDKHPEPFPRTPWTCLLQAQRVGKDERSWLERLFSIYWRPVYWHIRYQWHKSVEDAKDLTQEYFATFLEKEYLQSYQRERGRFRAFVKVSLDNFLRNRYRAAGRKIRGGHLKLLSLDVTDEPLPEVASPDLPAEELFDRRWASVVLGQALERMREHYAKRDKAIYCDIFFACEMPEGEKPTYEELGKRFGVSASDVRNYLHHVRVTFRSTLRAVVGETVERGGDVDEELDRLKALFQP